MSRYGLLLGVLMIGCVGFHASAADEKTPADAPAVIKAGLKESVIKGWMDKHYTDMGQYATKKETMEYTAIRYAEPREGNPISDGVPETRKTTAYPIKLSIIHTTSYPKENVTKKESIECSIVAWKDDFGEWTWRLKENKVEAIK